MKGKEFLLAQLAAHTEPETLTPLPDETDVDCNPVEYVEPAPAVMDAFIAATPLPVIRFEQTARRIGLLSMRVERVHRVEADGTVSEVA